MQENEIQCNSCEGVAPENEIHRHNDQNLCEDCYHDQYCCCEDCEDAIEVESATLINDRYICNQCKDNDYIRCHCCGEYESTDESFYVNDYGTVCDDCYSNGDFSFCGTCEESYCYEDMHFPEYDDPICINCRSDNNGEIHSYGYKPNPNFHHIRNGFSTIESRVLKKDTLYMGIELEIDSNDDNDSKNECAEKIARDESTFYCKNDSSLKHGFEIVSHPITWDYFKANKITFESVLKVSKENHFLSHDVGTCGMHIHVSKDSLSNLDIFKIVYFVFSNPDFIKIISNRNWHQINTWASVNIEDFLFNARNPKEKVRRLSEVAKAKSGGGRVAINLRNSQTIEFRIFRGTLNWKTYQKNIEFVHSLITWIKNTSLKHIQDKDSVFSFMEFLTRNQSEYQNLVLFLFKKFFSMSPRKQELPPLYNQMRHFDFYSKLNLKQLTSKGKNSNVHSNS